jgi:hypothetical protein
MPRSSVPSRRSCPNNSEPPHAITGASLGYPVGDAHRGRVHPHDHHVDLRQGRRGDRSGPVVPDRDGRPLGDLHPAHAGVQEQRSGNLRALSRSGPRPGARWQFCASRVPRWQSRASRVARWQFWDEKRRIQSQNCHLGGRTAPHCHLGSRRRRPDDVAPTPRRRRPAPLRSTNHRISRLLVHSMTTTPHVRDRFVRVLVVRDTRQGGTP